MIRITISALFAAWAAWAQVNVNSNLLPATATPGVTVVTLTGAGFPAGAYTAAQITVRLTPRPPLTGTPVEVAAAGLQLIVGTTRRVTFMVPSTVVVPGPSPFDVAVSGPGFTSLNTATLTVAPAPGILSVATTGLVPGQPALLLARTQLINFPNPAIEGQAGAGVATGAWAEGTQPPPNTGFGDFGRVLVVHTNTVLTILRPAVNAAPGSRDWTLRQGSATWRRPAALNVENTATPNASLALVTLANPTPGAPSATLTMGATGLPAGSLLTNQMRLLVEPRTGTAPPFLLTPTAVTPDSAGARTITFQLPTNIAAGEHLITLYGTTSEWGQLTGGVSFASVNRSVLTVLPPPISLSLTTVQPAATQPGTVVTVTGAGFPSGALPPGSLEIRLAGAGAFPVLSVSAESNGSRSLTFTAPAVTPNTYALTVQGVAPGTITSGNSLPFTIQPPPRLLSVSPDTGSPGQAFPVTISGEFTSFNTASHAVSLGAGITLSNVAAVNATTITATAAIAESALPGPRTLAVTSGALNLSLANAFLVQQSSQPAGLNQVVSPMLSLRNGEVPAPAPGLSSAISSALTVRNGTLPDSAREAISNLLSVSNGGGAPVIPPGEAVSALLSLRNGPAPGITPVPGASEALSSPLSLRNGPAPGLTLPPGTNETLTALLSLGNGNLLGPAFPATAVSNTVSARNDAGTSPAEVPVTFDSSADEPADAEFSPGTNGDFVTPGATVRLRYRARNPSPLTIEFRADGALLDRVSEDPFEAAFVMPARPVRLQALVDGAPLRERVLTPLAHAVHRVILLPVLDAEGQPLREQPLEILRPGLRAEYFASAAASLEHRAPTRVSAVSSLAWPNPDAVFGPDPWATELAPDFTARFTGFVEIEDAGQYRFRAASNGGVKLLVDGEPADEARLFAAGRHRLELIYQSGGAAPALDLRWSRAEGSWRPVPADWLWHAEPARTDAGGRLTLTEVAPWAARVRASAESSAGAASLTPDARIVLRPAPKKSLLSAKGQ